MISCRYVTSLFVRSCPLYKHLILLLVIAWNEIESSRSDDLWSTCTILIHEGEEEAYGRSDQCMRGLVEKLRGEDAPDKEMVAQRGDQHYVEHGRDGAQQGETVTAVAERHRSETERERKRE